MLDLEPDVGVNYLRRGPTSRGNAWERSTARSPSSPAPGAGIGRGEAMLLAAEGASVVVNDLGVAREGDADGGTPAQAVVDEITAAGGTAITSGARRRRRGPARRS